uniref:Uncharacterized protein n=1 Tax=Solanum tuberosum TaxID=4113 RepID=M1DDB5_SOLTU
MIYRDRTGTGSKRNRNEPVPVYRYQIMIPFCSVYRFNVSHPVLNTTGPERYQYNPFRCPTLVSTFEILRTSLLYFFSLQFWLDFPLGVSYVLYRSTYTPN